MGDRWEVAIAPSDDGFQQFSFVNSIATTKGGTHVDHVANQVVEKLLEVMKKKHKGMEKMLKPAHIKSHIKVTLAVSPHGHPDVATTLPSYRRRARLLDSQM